MVERVIDNIILPSSNHFGLKVTRPGLGPLSVVPPRTMAALVTFTDTASGTLPLSRAEEAAWRAFLITACQEPVAFDMDELLAWFVANGWSSEDARQWLTRFTGETLLLTEFADAARS